MYCYGNMGGITCLNCFFGRRVALPVAVLFISFLGDDLTELEDAYTIHQSTLCRRHACIE